MKPAWKFFLILICMYLGPLNLQATASADTLEANRSYRTGADFAKKMQPDSARHYLKRAANIYARENCWDRYFNAVNQVSFTYSRERKFERTISWADSILFMNGDKLDDGFKSIITYFGTKAWAYLSLSRFFEAEYFLMKSISLLDKNKYVTDNSRLWVYYTTARLYFRIGQYDLTQNYLDKCQAIAETNDNSEYLEYCYNLKGIIARRTGEYSQALNYYREVLDLAKKEPEIKLLQVYNNFGRLYHDLGRDSVALAFLDKGLKALWDYTDDYYGIESALVNNKVIIYIDDNQYDLARESLDRMLTRELDYYGKLTIESVNTLLNYGDLELKMNNYSKAEDHYRRTLGIIRNVYGAGSVRMVEILRRMGSCVVQQGKFEEGLHQIQNALTLVVPGFDSLDFFSNPPIDQIILDKLELLKTLQSKVDALIKWHYAAEDPRYLQAAIETNELAMDLFDLIRVNLNFGESQKVLTGLMRPLFEQTVTLHLMAIGSLEGQNVRRHYEAILNAMEGSKAFGLSVALQRSHMRGYSVVSDSANAVEMELLAKIAMYEKKISDMAVQTSVDTSESATMEKELFEVRVRFEDFRNQLALRYPEYERSRYSDLTFGLDDIQSGMTKNDLLITYFMGEKRVYAMSLDKSAIYVEDLGSREAIEKQIREFTSFSGAIDAAKYDREAFELHQKLLQPLFAKFKSKKGLIIIPDGVLGYLPFDALVYKLSDHPAFHNLNYEIRKYTITQHYLASLYLQKDDRSQGFAESFVGFAPDFSGEESVLLALRSATDSVRLTPLHFAQEEVKRISGLVQGRALIGNSAKESQFKKNAAKYKYIHVASHSLVNDRDPLYSQLIFAPEAEGDSTEDGILHTYELYHMKLNDNVVVLSACKTGTGAYQKGEGIISLARGFIYAGASGVLMSLWEVADKSTSDIMYYFYDELSGGKSRSEALREAKLRYLTNADAFMANPYYWAGFSYLGRREHKSSNMYIYIFLPLIVVITAGFIYMRRRLT